MANRELREREHVCEGCGLPEDGLRVRNVCGRNGQRLCADCAQMQKEEKVNE